MSRNSRSSFSEFDLRSFSFNSSKSKRVSFTPFSNNAVIDDLSDDLLSKVFSFLDLSSKKMFSLTCRRFNTIFSLDSNMKKIIFLVNGKSDFRRKLPLNVSRMYQTAKFQYLTPIHFSDTSTKLLMKTLSNKVTHFTLTQSAMDSHRFFKVLQWFNNTEALELRDIKIQSKSTLDTLLSSTKLTLPNLKCVSMDVTTSDGESTDIFLRIIKNVLVKKKDFTSIKLRFLSILNTSDSVKLCMKLLTRQENLKELHLEGKIGQFFKVSLCCSTNLETLMVADTERFDDIICYTHLINVIKSQKKLTKLKFPIHGSLVNAAILQDLMEIFNLPLKHLDISFDKFDPDLKTSEIPNLTLKTLKIIFTNVSLLPMNKNEETVTFLTKMFPNVNHLTFSNDSEICDSSQFCLGGAYVLSKWNGLKFLDFSELPVHHSCIAHVKFTKLHEINLLWTMDHGISNDYLCNFYMNNPGIKNVQFLFKPPHNTFSIRTILYRSLKMLKKLQRLNMIMIETEETHLICGEHAYETGYINGNVSHLIEEYATPGFELNCKIEFKNEITPEIVLKEM